LGTLASPEVTADTLFNILEISKMFLSFSVPWLPLLKVKHGETIFLENKSEIRGFVVEDTYFNLQFCTIFFIFFGALALFLWAGPRP
jgi:hypothetical protein